MWKLSIEDDQSNKTAVNLVREEYSLGRGDQNAVRLTERNISRNHALLKKNESAWLLRDLSSYNGCFVNGVRVSEEQHIDHGDLVQIGDYRLVITSDAAAGVTSGDKSAPALSVPRSEALLGQPDRLVMVVGPTPGAEFPLTGERLTLGRGEECDVAINHGSVSRVHAEIHSLGDGRYEVIDRESANGVRINGVELKRGLVDARDLVELGDVQLKFIPQGAVYAIGVEDSQRFEHDPRLNPTVFSAPQPAAAALPGPMKFVIGAAALGLLVVLGMLVLGGRSPAEAPVEATINAEARGTLNAARALLAQGNVDAAHLKLGAIPADSNLRQSQEFRDIEGAWADALLANAGKTHDLSAKRTLLDRVAKATTVDDGRRKLAADQIAALDGEGVDPSELERQKVAREEPTITPGGVVRKNPFGAPDEPAAPHPAPGPAPPPGPAPAPASLGQPTAKDLAQSGDRANAARAKAIYEAKANSGRATMQDLRMLRALCGQLKDAGCRARASALMAQKKGAGGE